jgi:hypothetical protein
MKVKRS